MANLEKKVFMICPVRNLTPQEDSYLKGYIGGLEDKGYTVHYPPRDTNQNDPIGLNICTENKQAIINSDEVQIYYNPTSTGTVFDLGMTFMAEKPLYIINAKMFKDSLEDNFSKFLFKYAFNTKMKKEVSFYQIFLKRREEIKRSRIIFYEWEENSVDFLFDFGMAFMAGKHVALKNRAEIRKTSHKSFQNVLLELDDRFMRTFQNNKK